MIYIYIYILEKKQMENLLIKRPNKFLNDVTYAIGKSRAWNAKYKKPHSHKSIGIAECTSKINSKSSNNE